MSNFFNQDSPVMNIITTICDVILLNLIFMVSCLPLITIGASVTALYYVTLKIIRGEGPSVWQSFWKSFRENFKQSTGIWLIFLCILILLGVDFQLLPQIFPDYAGMFRVIIAFFILFVCTVLLYVFPVVSRFVCTGKQAIKNAVLMTFGHLPYTLILLLIHAIIPMAYFLPTKTFLTAVGIFLVCGFSTIALLASYFLNRVFKRYEV